MFIMNEIKLYTEGLSIPELSEVTGIPISTLRFRLKKAGVLRTRKEGIKLAAGKGRLGGGLRGKKRPPRSKEWSKKISEALKGKGKGFSIKPNGYIEITTGENKGRSEHVVIMENMIGRRLYSNECVHHVNGDRSDNRIENLQLMYRSEHAAHHAKDNIKNRKRDKKGRLI